MDLKEIVNENFDIVKNGYYICSDGTRYDIKEAIVSGENNQEFVEGFIYSSPGNSISNCKIYVTDTGTMEQARIIKDSNIGDKVCILNFASAKNPGGGYLSYRTAQEEDLCYKSNLYNCLSKNKEAYEYSRAHLKGGLYSDIVIYSDKIVSFRDKDMNLVEPLELSCITCPAPNRRATKYRPDLDYLVPGAINRRAELIFQAAINNKVDHLVLGAWGCGVFKNSPEVVAKAFKYLCVKYGGYFKSVTFAMNRVDYNYSVFNTVLK